MAAHVPRQKVMGNRLQARLRRRRPVLVEFVQTLAPPGEPDRTKPRIAARRHDIGERQVEVPQCGKGGSGLARQLLERDLAVVVEPPLSDR